MCRSYCLKFPFVLLFLAWVGFADETVATQEPDMLDRAWEEYRFLSLDQAESYFKQVQSKDGDTERVREAKLGLAMIKQYAESGKDLAGAEAMYKEILNEGAQGEVAALIRLNLADILIAAEEEEALSYLNS